MIFEGIEYRRYDHIYHVSSCGKFLRFGEPYAPWNHPAGYFGVGRQRLAHRMVAKCWIVCPDPKMHVHHKNHDKKDNRAENLEWIYQSDHMGRHHRDAIKGLVRSEETREKIRQARLGKKDSAETREKKRLAAIRSGCRPPAIPVGSKRPASFVQKMLEGEHARKQRCEVNGIAYQSFSAAARALGELPLSLRKRCLSENFPNYKILLD